IQQSAVTFASRDLTPAKFALDGDGHLQLPSGGAFHQMLARVLDTTPLGEAGAIVQALARLDPLARAVLGGEAMVEAARAVLERRGAVEDEEVRGLIEVRRLGDAAERVVHGDRSTVTQFVAEA